MRELFIYYRIQTVRAAAALAAVQAMQQGLCDRHPRLAARLLRRPDEPGDNPNDTPNDQQTWMETYSFPDAGGGVSFELQAEIEAHAADVLMPFVLGARHIEIFVPCAS
jgi:hypothetical protein